MSKGASDSQERVEGPGRKDATAARRAAQAPPSPIRRRGRPPIPPTGSAAAAAPQGEAPQPDAGEQLQTLWNELAKMRRYRKMDDQVAGRIGIAATMVDAKRGGALSTFLMRFPELLLLGLLGPFVAHAVSAELRRLMLFRAKLAAGKSAAPADRRTPPAAAPSAPAAPRAPAAAPMPAATPTPPTGGPKYEGRSLGELEG